MTTKRDDSFYEIAALTRGMAVMEALEGTSFEPVSLKRIMQRCGFSKDITERTLKTFRLRGWAIQNERGEWMVGPRFIRFARTAVRSQS